MAQAGRLAGAGTGSARRVASGGVSQGAENSAGRTSGDLHPGLRRASASSSMMRSTSDAMHTSRSFSSPSWTE
jgi:hypothetical protein